MVAMVAAVAGAAAATASLDAAVGVSRCPSSVDVRRLGNIEQAVSAAARLIPNAFHANDPGNEWARHPLILEMVALIPGPPKRSGVSQLRRVAIARCGRGITDRSWAAVVDFPGIKVAGEPPATIFLSDTRHGWVLWH